jgi:5-methylcytosine-specific restriction endonuclease McrA
VTIFRLCSKCGAKIPATPHTRGPCSDCKRAENRRRNEKRKASGRKSAAWTRLRLAALHRDRYSCRRCGRAGDARTLTVHLAPELHGEHWRARLDDLETLCRRCHGSVDAPRAHEARLF